MYGSSVLNPINSNAQKDPVRTNRDDNSYSRVLLPKAFIQNLPPNMFEDQSSVSGSSYKASNGSVKNAIRHMEGEQENMGDRFTQAKLDTLKYLH